MNRSRLQTGEGSRGPVKGYGRSLPQGGFQSIDITYSAQEKCRIIPFDAIPDYGVGYEDVSDYADNPVEDETATVDNVALDEDDAKNKVVYNEGTTKVKLSNGNKVQLDDD